MALYRCKVIDESGIKSVIKIDALSINEIKNNLKNNNYIIIDVKKAKDNYKFIKFKDCLKKVKSKDLYIFCNQLHSMLKAGINIVNCIEILSIQTENKRFRNVINKLYEKLQTGYTFSQALTNQKQVFPDVFCSMIESGEMSGNLDAVIERLSCQFEKEYKIENKIKSATTYPAILSIVSTSVVIFLLVKVMPTFTDLYENSGIPLPPITVFLLFMSNSLKRFWYLFFIIIIVSIFALHKAYRLEKIKLKIDFLKTKIPLYKNLIIKLSCSRFTRTLATLTGSGVPLLQALEKVSQVIGNSYIASLMLQSRDEVRNGLSFSETIRRKNIFPIMVYYMIKIGEDSGSLEELLDKTADIYDEEVENAVEKLITLIEPVMIVFMAAIIGFIVLAMVTPMFDMIKIVQ